MFLRALTLGFFLSLTAAAPLRAAEPPLKVVASFTVLADMVRQIAGDLATVSVLVGPGVDAHTFQPTPRDAQTVLAADLVVMNGLGFEGWANRLIRASGYKGKIVEAAAGIAARDMPAEDDDDKAVARAGRKFVKPATIDDPHVWNSMVLAQRQARTIGAALAAARPAEAPALLAATEDYAARLAALDRYARDEIGKLAPERRRAITSHDAFGYLASEYGLTFLSPVGVTTESEPSAAGLAKLIRQIRAEKIPAVFVESVGDQRLAQQIARESGAKIGGSLYSDSLSAADGPAATLEKMFRHNIDTLIAGLRE